MPNPSLRFRLLLAGLRLCYALYMAQIRLGAWLQRHFPVQTLSDAELIQVRGRSATIGAYGLRVYDEIDRRQRLKNGD